MDDQPATDGKPLLTVTKGLRSRAAKPSYSPTSSRRYSVDTRSHPKTVARISPPGSHSTSVTKPEKFAIVLTGVRDSYRLQRDRACRWTPSVLPPDGAAARPPRVDPPDPGGTKCVQRPEREPVADVRGVVRPVDGVAVVFPLLDHQELFGSPAVPRRSVIVDPVEIPLGIQGEPEHVPESAREDLYLSRRRIDGEDGPRRSGRGTSRSSTASGVRQRISTFPMLTYRRPSGPAEAVHTVLGVHDGQVVDEDTTVVELCVRAVECEDPAGRRREDLALTVRR